MLADARRILVPIDGSPTSNKALAAAVDVARGSGAQVRLLHSVEPLAVAVGFDGSGDYARAARDNGRRVLDDALAVARAAGVQGDSRLIEFSGERLGETVADEAREWEADLIVVGTHGRRGIGRVLLGSGAEQIIRLAPVPVLVIRGEPELTQSSPAKP